MKPHLAFLLSSAAVLITAGATQAAPSAPSPIAGAQSYVDLLDSVPDAGSVLVADDLARAQQPKPLWNDLAQDVERTHASAPG